MTIQRDMLDAARMLPGDQGRDLIYALAAYGLDGELPDEGEPWYPMWLITKGRIEASVKRNAINKEMTERRLAKQGKGRDQRDAPKDGTNGDNQRSAPEEDTVGGDQSDAPKQPTNTENSSSPKQPSEVRSGEDGVKKGVEKGGVKKGARKRFRAPTVEEVAAYAKEQALNVDAVHFCDYYESCGWTVGRNRPMRDWRAAARRWSRNEFGDTREVQADGWYDFDSLRS